MSNCERCEETPCVCWANYRKKIAEIKDMLSGLSQVGSLTGAGAYSATFRTEYLGDGERVPALLKHMGLRVVRAWMEEDVPDYYLCFFTVAVPVNIEIEDLRETMTALIETDEQFADLHRCHQTLAVGEYPRDPFSR